MNILILSCGTRNKIVQYFKNAVAGSGIVVATDMSPYAPALYDADKHYIVPRMTDPGYLDIILGICRKENITGVLSLIDPELSLLAKNRDRFAEAGTTVIGSGYEQCERSLDKMQMYQWLTEHSYLCARSYTCREDFYTDLDAGLISFPVFVKPVCGSASISISKVYDRETVDFLFERNDNLMIQEFLNGQEIGADVYIDMISGQVVSIFTKKKLLMRAGETDKAVSFRDPELFSLVTKIDIDIFDVGGQYYISEVNPRFGGGYPHAYECGVDHTKLICNNLNGIANTPRIGSYEDGMVMMKYIEIKVQKDTQ